MIEIIKNEENRTIFERWVYRRKKRYGHIATSILRIKLLSKLIERLEVNITWHIHKKAENLEAINLKKKKLATYKEVLNTLNDKKRQSDKSIATTLSDKNKIVIEICHLLENASMYQACIKMDDFMNKRIVNYYKHYKKLENECNQGVLSQATFKFYEIHLRLNLLDELDIYYTSDTNVIDKIKELFSSRKKEEKFVVFKDTHLLKIPLVENLLIELKAELAEIIKDKERTHLETKQLAFKIEDYEEMLKHLENEAEHPDAVKIRSENQLKIKSLQELVIQDKIELLMKEIDNYFESNANKFILLSSNYHSNERDYRENIITDRDFRMNKIKIKLAFLDKLDQELMQHTP